MKIQVLLFGPLAEVAGTEQLELTQVPDTDVLRQLLLKNYPALADCAFQVAVNRKLALLVQPLQDGDEVALLAPFSGG